MRLRTTAFPVFLVTVKPKRGGPSAESRSIACSSRAGRPALRPLATARYCGRERRRSKALLRDRGAPSASLRPRAACAHARGGRRLRSDHRGWPSEPGSHGDASGRSCWADTCASLSARSRVARSVPGPSIESCRRKRPAPRARDMGDGPVMAVPFARRLYGEGSGRSMRSALATRSPAYRHDMGTGYAPAKGWGVRSQH